jgi:predicted DNA-binding transcriptional regulator AlpA/DNA-binding XRE family transcriptional regulator
LSSRLGMREVMARTGRHRVTIFRWVQRGWLPPPAKCGRANRWDADAVDAALARATARHESRPRPLDPSSSPLAQARQRRGWSQARLANLLGVATSDVTAWERGTRPGFRHRPRVAALLGAPVASLWPHTDRGAR